jgi:hypothetical protein
LFKTINAGQPVSIDRTDVGERRKALPEGGEVVDFPVSRGKGRR